MDNYWRRQLYGKVLCLLYHRVDEPGRYPFLDQAAAPVIAPEVLVEELRFLQAQGARFMTFADLRRGAFPDDSEFGVIISFDDGFRDNYTLGLEVLEVLSIRGVLFQSTALVDAESLIWEHALYWHWRDEPSARAFIDLAHDRLPASRFYQGGALMVYLREQVHVLDLEKLLRDAGARPSCQLELAQQLYPTAKHLRRAQAAGHEIGSHGHHHYKRSTIDAGLFEDELRRSVAVLEGVLGEPPAAFSYPFNSYLPDDAAHCARYFQQAATVDAALIKPDCDPFRLPRFTWPGPLCNGLRRRRWLLTGHI